MSHNPFKFDWPVKLDWPFKADWPFKPRWWASDTVWLSAMAAVAVGMFVGTWVIGPAISTDSAPREALRSGQFERLSLDEARARPDPSPYRTPTPEFAAPASTNYARIARQKAQASAGDDDMPDVYREPSREWRFYAPSRSVDRHTGVRY
jgi:hypothetical protein